jgi:hypothetical protein
VTIRKRTGSGDRLARPVDDHRRSQEHVREPGRPEPSPGALIEFEKHGDPADKVDLLLLGDGYTAAERKKFEADSKRLLAVLFATSPFKERRTRLQRVGAGAGGRESGISRPSYRHLSQQSGEQHLRRVRLRALHLAFDNKRSAGSRRTRRTTWWRSSSTAGPTAAAASTGSTAPWRPTARSPYIFVHEFGHHFAALADEYYTSPVAYLPSTKREEPWEPNVSALPRPRRAEVEGPGQARHAAPDPLAEGGVREAVPRVPAGASQAARRQPPRGRDGGAVRQDPARGHRDVLEISRGRSELRGGSLRGHRLLPSEADCIMFTRSDFFCEVCRRALDRVIDTYSRN